jgi:hypothetical protein
MFNNTFSYRVTNDVPGNRYAVFISPQKMIVETSLPNSAPVAVLPSQLGRPAFYFPDKLDDAFRFRSAQQKVSVIRHNAICIQGDIVLFAYHPQQGHEILSYILLREDRLLPLGSYRDKTW